MNRKRHSLETQNIFDMYVWKAEPLFRMRHLVWVALLSIELLLITRFFLKLLTPQVGVIGSFLTWITDYFLLLPSFVLGVPLTAGPVFEWITLFSIFLYWFIGMGVLVVFRKDTRTTRIEIARAYSKKKYGY